PVRDVPVGPVTVTVPPRQDVYVPFELSIVDLDSGWYGLEIDVDLDGSPKTLFGDRRFSVGWPRGSMRTGTVRVGRAVRVGSSRVTVGRVQLAADSATVALDIDPPGPLEVELMADGGALTVLEVEREDESRTAVVRAYPVPRGTRTVTVMIRSGDATGHLD